MAPNIGLNVIEVDGTAAPAIQGASTSVGAFNVATRRGVPNQPVRITSFAQFVERFGGFDSASIGAYLVRGFFENGGQFAWVNRTAGTGAQAPGAASGVYPDGAAPADRLVQFTAGYRGVADPGPWANQISLSVVPSFSTTLKTGNNVAATSATLNSVAGFSVGDAIVVRSASNKAVVTLSEINAAAGAITWAPPVTAASFGTDTSFASADFDLAILDVSSGAAVQVEAWERLSLQRTAPRYVVTVLNDSLRGSKFVKATDARPTAQVGADSTGVPADVTIGGGTTGTLAAVDVIGTADAHTGFFAFDPFDVQLVCCDRTDAATVTAALSYCEARGDCMFIGSVPEASVGGGTAIDYGAQFQGKKVFGALYGPFVTVTDPLSRAATPVRSLPPTGHVMGVYGRIASARGIHKAPAGDDVWLLGVVDVEYRLSDAEHTDLAKTGSVNGIRVVPGAGIVIDASRTLSTDTRWLYVNVRLLFNYVKSSLRQGLRWVRQEPNQDSLWTAVKYGSVKPFLMGLWRQGAFGTGEPDDVFTIICDASNNPPDEVDKGNFMVELYFYPSKPAETIVIIVGQQPSGGSAAEA